MRPARIRHKRPGPAKPSTILAQEDEKALHEHAQVHGIGQGAPADGRGGHDGDD